MCWHALAVPLWNRRIDAACFEAGAGFVVAGTLTVVGPVAATELWCTLGLPCAITLMGAEL